MRNFKFRAWIHEDSNFECENKPCMVTDFAFEDYISVNDQLYKMQYDRNVLMQYTGLKDKKGREIYEGDIYSYELYKVFISGGDVEESTSKCFDVVVFKNGAFYHGEELLADVIENDAIIDYEGNIYENPELLEVIK